MYLFINFLFLFCAINKCDLANSPLNPEIEFVKWNTFTLKSLKRQAKLSDDSAIYLNQLSAFKAYMDINDEKNINKKSIRYQFLKEIKHKDMIRNYIVIEADNSGETVLIRNFIIFIDPDNKTHIDIYTFSIGKWNKIGGCIIDDKLITDDLKTYILKQGLGFNNNDIIISKFINNSVKESEYYLHSTLSSYSGVKKILACFRKENFNYN